jgi:hypothetical protein
MTGFEAWLETTEGYGTDSCSPDAAWQASREQAIKEATEVAVQYIKDQGTIQCGKEDIYYIDTDDLSDIAAAIEKLGGKG